MPIISQQKRECGRASDARKLNRGNRSRLRTSLRTCQRPEGDGKAASEILPATIFTIDRAVQKGVLHKNTPQRDTNRD